MSFVLITGTLNWLMAKVRGTTPRAPGPGGGQRLPLCRQCFHFLQPGHDRVARCPRFSHVLRPPIEVAHQFFHVLLVPYRLLRVGPRGCIYDGLPIGSLFGQVPQDPPRIRMTSIMTLSFLIDRIANRRRAWKVATTTKACRLTLDKLVLAVILLHQLKA